MDWNSAPAIQDMPVVSAFQYPAPGSVVVSSETIEAKGYAWAGGGRGIIRVDVSAVISIVLASQNPIYIPILCSKMIGNDCVVMKNIPFSPFF